MKRLIYIIPIMLITFSLCSTGQNISSTYDDDIYFDPNDEPVKKVSTTSSNSFNSE